MKKELIKILIDKYTNYSEKTLLAFIKEGKVIVNGEKSFLPFMKFEITNLKTNETKTTIFKIHGLNY